MRLKEIRLYKRLTQQTVADYIGCSPVVYSRYECETRQLPVDILLKLADLYEVTTDYLLGRKEKEHIQFSDFELQLIAAARDTDERARKDALVMLLSHANEEKKSHLA